MLSSGFQLEWLTRDTFDTYLLFAPASIDQAPSICCPLRRWQHAGCHALGVSFLGLPIGLLLLQTRGSVLNRSAEVISLAIAESFRRRGLATRLLEATVQACTAAGISLLSLSYPIDNNFAEVMARLCSVEKGWQPTGGTVLYHCSTGDVPAFLNTLRPYSHRLIRRTQLSCVPYMNVTAMQLLKAQLKLRPPKWAVPQLPDARDSGWGTLDPACSQALMQGSELVGWCLCHRISSDAHRISIAYIAESLQSQGHLVIPIIETVNELAKMSEKVSPGMEHSLYFGVRTENKPMVRFSERRIQPHARTTTKTTEMTHRLRQVT